MHVRESVWTQLRTQRLDRPTITIGADDELGATTVADGNPIVFVRQSPAVLTHRSAHSKTSTGESNRPGVNMSAGSDAPAGAETHDVAARKSQDSPASLSVTPATSEPTLRTPEVSLVELRPGHHIACTYVGSMTKAKRDYAEA